MESISLIFKVLWAPGEALASVARSRKALAPIILLTLVGVGFVWVMFSHLNIGEMTLRAAEQSGRANQMTAEQRAQMIATVNGPIARGIGTVFAFIGPLLSVTVVAVIYFGLFTLIGREAGFGAFFAVTSYAFVPLIVRNIAGIIAILVVPQSQLMMDEIGNIGPTVFLDRTGISRYLFALASQVDVVSIWILILLVIGYRTLLRRNVSLVARVFGVFVLWGVYVLVRVALA